MTENVKYSSINEEMKMPRSFHNDNSSLCKSYSENSWDEEKLDSNSQEESKNSGVRKSIIPPNPDFKRKSTKNQQHK